MRDFYVIIYRIILEMKKRKIYEHKITIFDFTF